MRCWVLKKAERIFVRDIDCELEAERVDEFG
jgi:hypothetical protein